ncbi:DUF2905 domain-containing protein [Domibacillus indicus]|uniref:DUF2905 domain-containing protein n=1 Tax=Domibacillus TaxID=1433999 RepID=UPI00203FBD49|nr:MULTISPECIES: DUF2905 domain-containing protein [Domibacillus]MCM3786831.1 DUF2905 domain-containing protein [Domibacillus indicus]WNS81849.1 DUF2905 domain-containing protein [Domibacillus sp. DTU_2020_1001157_1_SI_ALB_TIR_016]
MTSMGKMLMAAGAVLFLIGLLVQFGKLGRLPGDIVIKKENATFYFPIVTSIVASIVLSLLFYVIGKWR